MTRRVRVEALVLLPALLILGLLWPIARPVTGSGDTFQFWYAGHLIATGASPYDQAAWHAAGERYGSIADNVASNCADPQALACVWAYPPLTAWAFAPFGMLPPAVGLPALDAFVLLTLLAGVVATATVFGPGAPGPRALLLAAAVAQHPFVIDVRAGHPVGLLLLAVAGLAHGVRLRLVGPVLLASLACALKPHVVAALAPTVLALLAAARQWRTIATVTATLVMLFAIALARSPEAVGVLGRAGNKASIAWTTTRTLAEWSGLPLLALPALVAIGAAAAVLAVRWTSAEDRAAVAVAAAAAFSLVVTPYAQPYDLLLTVPAFAATASAAVGLRAPLRIPLLAAAALVPVALTWGALVVAPPLYASLPLIALVLLALARAAKVRCGA